MRKKRSLNSYSHHAPRLNWFEQYFKYKDTFNENHSLGSSMLRYFIKFLKDACLLDKNGFTDLAKIVDKIKLRNPNSWGIILANLCYSPQIKWYIKNVHAYESYFRKEMLLMLSDAGASAKSLTDIWMSLVRILNLPFGEVGLGYVTKEKNRSLSLTRTVWENPEPMVVLYSLYKFAEVCGNYYQFTLTRLLNYDINSAGISPTEIYGIERTKMEKILLGLSINHPDYISVSFTHDLDNISLHEDKSSKDILKLF
jgi:phosphoadenosine phosphosulfate reductase